MGSFPDIIPKVLETVKASTLLAAQDVAFYASIDKELSDRFQSSAKSLLHLANDLLRQLDSRYQDVEIENLSGSKPSWKRIEETLDTTFEHVDYIIDSMQKYKKVSSNLTFLELNDGPELKFHNIEKPQKFFKEPVDNSDSVPFKPKLKNKPNALVALKDSFHSKDLPLNHFSQPYAYEIMHCPYPRAIFEFRDVLPPKDWSTTLATWVGEASSLRDMTEVLKSLKEIAVDLEHHDYRSYYGLTCLMQISNRERDWIIDTIALRDELFLLNEVFTNPHIIKVFHGASMDIIWLQRDFGIYVVSLFDTYHASKALGFPKFSLAYLLETYANFKTSKKYQLADWRIRPLPQVLLDYARADTHFLLGIFDKLRNLLNSSGKNKLLKVLDDSRLVACKKFEYKKHRLAPEEWSSFENREADARIIAQSNIPEHKKVAAKEILELRDVIAREKDESARFIMPIRNFVSLLTIGLPATKESVRFALGKSFQHFENNTESLLNILNSTQDVDEPEVANSSEPLLSSARYYAELFQQIVDKSFSAQSSDSLLLKQSNYITCLSDVSTTHRAKAQSPLTFAFEEFVAKFSSSGSSRQDLTEPASPEPKVDQKADNIQASGQDVAKSRELVLPPLKRRNVESSTLKKKAKMDDSVFNYQDREKDFLKVDPGTQKPRKSYETFKGSAQAGPKKPRGRRVQDGKTISFTKRN